ncbi:hypothetical protein P154DRAFT_612478 [Amniculicola lignicola CBS 123094]|uniref:Uncharacterized protein n=1 Tax=Amniculicola lignicola CBS 123094 TaxID=1392246 RepID=A0A6A5W118_9PLEO|nr:hypothetical protein P154DRAFT_612478 [Amniculicola lignicola CBS 123094]
MTSDPTTEVEWSQSFKEIPGQTGFLDLPREIRDLIYEYAFCVSGAIFVYSMDPYAVRPRIRAKIVREKGEGPVEPQAMGSSIPTALIRSCHQIHAECSDTLYGSNVFRMYMSNPIFAPGYLPFVRQIIFIADADHRIYESDLDTVSHGWRRRFWPNVMEKAQALLHSFPNLDFISFPIKSRPGETWRPAFMASDRKTREQRVSIAAAWMKARCPFQDEHLRQCLHLEIMPASDFTKESYEGSSFAPEDEWDHAEFTEAFEKMRSEGPVLQAGTPESPLYYRPRP